MSFLSSPIDANRKSLNSDPRTENEAERVISITELRCLYRTYRADIGSRGITVASNLTKPYCTTTVPRGSRITARSSRSTICRRQRSNIYKSSS
jgi:hypothetical protein